MHKGAFTGETSEGEKGKKPSNSVISGVAPDSAWPHGELWSINYISEIVLSTGKGTGVLYPPRNQSLTAGRPGSQGLGEPNLPALAARWSENHWLRCQHYSNHRMANAGKADQKGPGEIQCLTDSHQIFAMFMSIMPSGQGLSVYLNLLSLFLPAGICWVLPFYKMPTFLESYSAFKDRKHLRVFLLFRRQVKSQMRRKLLVHIQIPLHVEYRIWNFNMYKRKVRLIFELEMYTQTEYSVSILFCIQIYYAPKSTSLIRMFIISII